MAEQTDEREVRFDLYCNKCKSFDKADTDEPCDECLSNTTNMYTDKPVNYEEK